MIIVLINRNEIIIINIITKIIVIIKIVRVLQSAGACKQLLRTRNLVNYHTRGQNCYISNSFIAVPNNTAQYNKYTFLKKGDNQ